MVDTFTPAGCGGRTRRIIAVALFALGAVAAAMALGGFLGLVGQRLPGRAALWIAATLALLGALREAGLLRFPLPHLRRQVPEPWRREKPLAVWSLGYGIILGAGFGTFQPVATFWVVCTAALAIGSPATSAVCLGLFGLGRALMVVWPGRDTIERLTRAHRLVRPSNAIALAACAAFLIPAAARAAVAPPPALPSGQSDPSVSGTTIAYTDQANGVQNVVVDAGAGAPPIVFLTGRQPSLDGEQLAYVDDQGIRVVVWRTGQETARIRGAVSKPSLSGRRIAYVEVVGSRKLLRVRNLVTGAKFVATSVGRGVDLGRPSLRRQLIAWSENSGASNVIILRSLRSAKRTIIASGSRNRLHAWPSLTGNHISWITSRDEFSTVVVQKIPGGRARAVATARGPRFFYIGTSLTPTHIYTTRWSLLTNQAIVQRHAWTPQR